jgi:trk system potassium uptake protein TrkA
MERFTVIGLGNFGSFVATRLYQLGHDVIAIDRREEVIDRIGPYVTRAVAGDGTDRTVLEALGVRDSTAAIVSTGDDLAASVLSLLALRDLHVADIYVKVISEDHRRIVDALGAAESVFPERQAGEALATRLTSRRLLRYVEIDPELSLQEMAVPEAWTGKTLRELGLPAKYQVQVVALHDILRDVITVPDPDHKLTPSDTLLVAGKPSSLAALAKVH